MIGLKDILEGLSVASQSIRTHLGASQAVLEVARKGDASPVTKIDLEIHGIFQRLFPTEQFLFYSEESQVLPSLEPAPKVTGPLAQYVVLDPLDGTKGFLAGKKECCINLSIHRGGECEFASITNPFTTKTYLYLPSANILSPLPYLGSSLSSLSLHTVPNPGVRHAPPKIERLWMGSYTKNPKLNALIEKNHLEVKRMGSALKFAKVLEDPASAYIRLGPSHVWDVIAGLELILKAGGQVYFLREETFVDKIPFLPKIPSFVTSLASKQAIQDLLNH